MNILVEYAPGIAVLLVALGLLGYMAALAIAAFMHGEPGSLSVRLRTWFVSAPAQNIGIPCSAISAFAVVAVLLKVFPPTVTAGETMVLKAFDLEFSGPSGPITLWLICFLGFVMAMKLLRD